MMNKVPCAACGELKYESELLCWACGVATARAEPATATTPEPSAPPPPGPSPPAPTPQPPAPAPGDRRPAEIEAASLTDRPFVTPPVDAPELPRTPGDWAAYAREWAGAQLSGLRGAMDEYDRRRGVASGAFSSASCLATALALVVVAALASWLLPHLLGR